jgi:aspartyl-tRNA(Asn)/glutamyl-tRNA(Gln) amidotransferase subunit A
MTELTKMTLSKARDALHKGDVSSVEITEAHLNAIDDAKELNCFIEVTTEKAMDMAKAADETIKAGNAKGMTGIPIGIKDLYCTKGVHSQTCSHILDGFKPEYESTVSQNLWDDGAVMLG